MRFRKENLRNIKRRVQKQTGVQLEPERVSAHWPRIRFAAALALVTVLGLGMLAFSEPIFSPLDGDALALQGNYEGDGLVSVFVENGSEKELRFQHKLKLYNWGTGEEIPQTGEPVFYNSVIPPHSSGVMTIDLSEAYDISTLETTPPGETGTFYYYLLLTNQNFLFGQDWQCSFAFREEPEEGEATVRDPSLGKAQNLEEIDEQLRFYFQRDYWDQIPAMNEANFTYLQRVRELLLCQQGVHVRPVDPMLIVKDVPQNVIFDETFPPEQQNALLWEQYSSLDGYRRVVGSCFNAEDSDQLLQLHGMLPQYRGQTDGGIAMIPLIFLATFDAASAAQEDTYTFLAGQVLPFRALEKWKIYEDENYVMYQVTQLYYQDLDSYIDYFLTTNEKIYFDETIRQRLHRIHDYFLDPEKLQPLLEYRLP